MRLHRSLAAALAAVALALPAAAATLAQGGGEPPPSAPSAPIGATPEENGATLFEQRCAKCHGLDGKAATKAGQKWHIDDFTTARWQQHATDAHLHKAIEDGFVSRKTGERKMPAFKGKLSPAQVDLLIAHLRKLGKR